MARPTCWPCDVARVVSAACGTGYGEQNLLAGRRGKRGRLPARGSQSSNEIHLSGAWCDGARRSVVRSYTRSRGELVALRDFMDGRMYVNRGSPRNGRPTIAPGKFGGAAAQRSPGSASATYDGRAGRPPLHRRSIEAGSGRGRYHTDDAARGTPRLFAVSATRRANGWPTTRPPHGMARHPRACGAARGPRGALGYCRSPLTGLLGPSRCWPGGSACGLVPCSLWTAYVIARAENAIWASGNDRVTRTG